MNAVIMDEAIIGPECVVAATAFVKANPEVSCRATQALSNDCLQTMRLTGKSSAPGNIRNSRGVL
jgi:carbonic anhydrase/acetyltransferase-like protein (isoleucine patch superfamily)